MTNPLVGAWRLASFQTVDEDGTVTHPRDPDPTGLLIYTADGQMSVFLGPASRKNLPVADLRSCSPEDVTGAVREIVAYAGTYTVQGNTVIHHVKHGLVPNWVGGDLVRRIQLDRDELTLTTTPLPFEHQIRTAMLTWRRLPNGSA
jgi:hypothetical protein